ncbi:molybdopterin-dependent oxidoreductase [Thermodesulfobacteriota bacterium]
MIPGASFSEKGGSFTNMEGRIQFFDPIVNPPDEARSDWEILCPPRLCDHFGNARAHHQQRIGFSPVQGKKYPVYHCPKTNDFRYCFHVINRAAPPTICGRTCKYYTLDSNHVIVDSKAPIRAKRPPSKPGDLILVFSQNHIESGRKTAFIGFSRRYS